MAAFPSWVKKGFPAPESASSVVLRSEMERGLPKQRRIASDALVQQDYTLYFTTAAQANDWDTWFYTTIHAGQDWFDFYPSRTSAAVVQARIVGGEPGQLKPSTKTWAYAERTVKIEWQRSAV